MATKKDQPQNLFRRLTKLFRSGPVVKKKIRTLDTTIAVADKTKSSGTLLFQKSIAPTYATITANAYNLSERLMRYQDFQEMEYTPEIAAALDIYADETCLSGDSIIPLLDGTKPTVRELFEKGTENFWVYSYDLSTNKIVPGLATKVIKTCKKKIYRISLDDNTCLRLTDNHKVLLSDGTYVEVKDLKIGTSVRSLHTFNHQVVSIVEENIEDVFDLEVKEWHNFAVTATPGSTSYVFVHNCAQDEKGRVLHIYSENEKIKEILEDLFYNTLNVEFNLRSWARNLVKYGDFFLYNDVSPDYGVVSAFPVPVNEIEREENYDREDPFAVRYRWVTLGNRVLENWEITHFRLLGNDMFLPYGSSVIEPARRIWRQLILIEDAMLVYRVVRAPERRVFYIDVANIPPSDVPTYVEEQRKNLRTNQVIDRTTGRVDLRYNPLSVDEDYFIPVRGVDTGTKIETLAGGQNAAAVEDVAYIQKKLFAALKIPRAYLGYDEMLSSKATLAQEDIRFSRTINVIQKVMLAELNKLAIIHLFAHGFDSDDLQNFVLRLSNPSTVAQQQKLELWRTKFEIGGSAPEGYVNKDFIRKEIWGLNDEECKKIDKNRMKDKIVDATIESAQAEGGGGDAGGGGGGDMFGGGGEEAGGGEETPPEENAGEVPEEEVNDEVELLTSGNDPDDEETYRIKFDPTFVKVPIEAQKKLNNALNKKPSQLDVALYNKSRRRTHGASKTHFPDFNKMTSNDNPAMEDPYDQSWIKSVVSNPLGESSEYEEGGKTNLPSDLRSMLGKWSKKFGKSDSSPNILSESENIGDKPSTGDGNDLYILDGEE